jgi:uncharacterized coiled-coil protein SlyX
MVSIAERVAYLEGQSGEQMAAIDDLRKQVGELRGDVNDLRGDMDRRFERLEDRFDRRFSAVDTKCSWLVGLQVATLLVVIAALAAPYFR